MQALLVVDMQQAMHEPGRTTPHQINEVIEQINSAARAMRAAGRPVIFIQHEDPVDGFAPGERAWELLPELDRAAADRIVPKATCDAFYDTSLLDVLNELEVDSVAICGWATDFCVDTTVRAAASQDLAVTVLGDAHTAADRSHLDAAAIIRHHNATWDDMVVARSIRVISTRELEKELESPHPAPELEA